jgi:hypothetical protein
MTTQDLVNQDHRPDNTVQITVVVNSKPVVFERRHVTGIELKDTAISQGVNIQRDFVLFEVKGPGHLKPVGDNDQVTLNPKDEFRAVAPDDNSGEEF